jgi:hypothetical protein
VPAHASSHARSHPNARSHFVLKLPLPNDLTLPNARSHFVPVPRKEYIKFGLAKWGLLFVERGVQIAVVERVVGPTDSVYAPIVGHTFVC